MAAAADARLDRQFERISRQVPASRGFLDWVRKPRLHIVRIPLAILLILGGIFSFLPVLGIWMLPLGLLVLAVDIPQLLRPVGDAIVTAIEVPAVAGGATTNAAGMPMATASSSEPVLQTLVEIRDALQLLVERQGVRS